MERRRPANGEFYRHFKGNLYQVKMLAKDSETQAWMVVYQGMYPPFQCWVRGLREFMEPVDRVKYPDCSQRYRFEKVEEGELYSSGQVKVGGIQRSDEMRAGELSEWERNSVDVGNDFAEREIDVTDEGTTGRESAAMKKENRGKDFAGGKRPVAEGRGEPGEISGELFRKAITSGQPERYLRDAMTDEQVAERGFLELLDAETFREKRQIFLGLRNYLTPLHISNIAVALDIALEEGDYDEKFESVLRCMEAFEHYEGGRLR